jgi:biopolymer transport protein ExbD/biopolymer transport protein TolR
MAFDVHRGKPRRRPQMNVTPLVDVVLVLLIIFMVVTPMLTRKFWVNVPVKEEAPSPQPPSTVPLVLRLSADGGLRLNQEEISEADLPERLPRVFAARTDRVLFFDADEKAPFGKAVEVMDAARGAGALTIAVLTQPPQP